MPNHLEERFARLGRLQPKHLPECPIHHPNPAPIIHDNKTVEHRAEDCLDAEFAFAKAFLELALPIDQRFESGAKSWSRQRRIPP